MPWLCQIYFQVLQQTSRENQNQKQIREHCSKQQCLVNQNKSNQMRLAVVQNCRAISNQERNYHIELKMAEQQEISTQTGMEISNVPNLEKTGNFSIRGASMRKNSSNEIQQLI